MSVFTALPQDILQHEITRFLEHRDITSFNEILKNGERVYKKLPIDYALNHHILLLKDKFNKIAYMAQLDIDYAIAGLPSRDSVSFLAASWLKLFNFLADPFNKLIFMYQQGLKESQLRTVHNWQNDLVREDFYMFLSEEEKNELTAAAVAAADAINSTPFVRHIKVSRAARAIF
jgi:hypothetical protein